MVEGVEWDEGEGREEEEERIPFILFEKCDLGMWEGWYGLVWMGWVIWLGDMGDMSDMSDNGCAACAMCAMCAMCCAKIVIDMYGREGGMDG